MYDKNLKAADKLLIEDMEKANLKEMSATINVEIVDRSVAFGKKVAELIAQSQNL